MQKQEITQGGNSNSGPIKGTPKSPVSYRMKKLRVSDEIRRYSSSPRIPKLLVCAEYLRDEVAGFDASYGLLEPTSDYYERIEKYRYYLQAIEEVIAYLVPGESKELTSYQPDNENSAENEVDLMF